MELPAFGVEEWLNEKEHLAKYDIAGSSVLALSLEELLTLSGQDPNQFYVDLQSLVLDYGWIEGSMAFKEDVAALYQNQSSDNVLQTNGATGVNLLAIYGLINRDDHVIIQYPGYQQLYDMPRSLGAKVDLWHARAEDR
ncbi:putative dipeptidase [Streptococcus ictaluri 707-05]|uniref:Dipeptidase n=1 Tax=Streptococcus ictaluri 707-05 TaxID=764299 RepID=G5K3X5_9STRE|nr:putative dipeptidase [Streptococcus ictaluri 707-05]